MKKLYYDLGISFLLLVVTTIIFRVTDIDLSIQSFFYSSEDGWFLNNNYFVQFIYRYSNIPALIVSVTALIVLAVGFTYKKLAMYRKLSLFLVLTMIIGPGIIVNSVFKENWGRPRPRQITQFEGRMEHLPVLDRGIAGKGKSFPCGHASMGFYFFAFYFILRKKRKKLANLFFGVSLFSGLLIGLVRVVQGGHFTSDVIWSGVINYLSACLLYYMLRLNKNIYLKEKDKINFSKPIAIGLIAFSPILIYFILLATPFYRYRIVEVDLEDSEKHNIMFIFDGGDVSISVADSIYFVYEATGFSFPGARLVLETDTVYNDDSISYHYKFNKRGHFTELNKDITLYLKPAYNIEYSLRTRNGNVYLLEEAKVDSLLLNIESVFVP